MVIKSETVCKDTTLLTRGAAITREQTTQYTYIEAPPPLCISYASPEQTEQDLHQETQEAAGDKGQ